MLELEVVRTIYLLEKREYELLPLVKSNVLILNDGGEADGSA